MWKERSHGRAVPFNKLAPQATLDAWAPRLLEDPVPPRLRIYSPKERGLLAEAILKWTKAGIIESTRAFVRCNPTFALKKNGSVRVCIDFTPINKVIADLEWPMPRIQDIRFKVAGATLFSRLDLKDAFHRICIPEEHRALAAFSTPFGDFQFNKLPFGHKTGPATFQRFMDYSLRKHSSYVINYIDDILIFSDSDKHEQLIRSVLRTLATMRVTINWEKSELRKKTLEFVGIRLSKEGLSPSQLICQISDRDVPYTIKDRQSFLGFASYFRDFIPNFSTLANGLYPSKNDRVKDPDYRGRIKILIQACLSYVTLNHYSDDHPCTLYTDASLYAAGCVLVQQGKVVAIYSKTFTSSQTKYSATDREHLALLLGCERFRVFIQSNKCLTVKTDHRALLNRSDDNLTPRQVRWKYRINVINPRVEYQKGTENPADYMSRKGSHVMGAK